MRHVAVVVLVLLTVPVGAAAQSFELYASGGPTVSDRGYSVAAGGGASPASRLTLLASVERTQLFSRTVGDPSGRVISSFRGGSLLSGIGELRVALMGRNRIGPYAVAGFAAGVWRSNATASSPAPDSDGARAIVFGGGLQVPIGARAATFVDLRMVLGVEGSEGIIAVAPLRAGLAWRF